VALSGAEAAIQLLLNNGADIEQRNMWGEMGEIVAVTGDGKGTNGLSRAQLLEHKRIGTRWYTLVGPYLIILFLYTARAETIM
jgi:hypothetical protein